jgi:hypothetical protein
VKNKLTDLESSACPKQDKHKEKYIVEKVGEIQKQKKKINAI